jgi:hypothetical protein
MSLLGWAKLLDSLAPRCPRCNRKLRNVFKCKTCGSRFCSESCGEKHFNLMHAPAIAKRQADEQLRLIQKLKKENDAAIAAAKKEPEDLRRRREQAALAKQREREQRKREKEQAEIAKEQKLDRLENEIQKARELHDARLEAWRQAGSPRVEEAELNRARDLAHRLRDVATSARRHRQATYLKIAYFGLAKKIRDLCARIDMPWFVPALISATIGFAVGVLLAMLVSKSVGLTFATGGIGFVLGFAGIVVPLFFPDADLPARITELRSVESHQLEALEAANSEYEKAQDEYNRLERLDEMRRDCDKASNDNERLREEYRLACEE